MAGKLPNLPSHAILPVALATWSRHVLKCMFEEPSVKEQVYSIDFDRTAQCGLGVVSIILVSFSFRDWVNKYVPFAYDY